MKLKLILPFFTYIVINSIFVLKYTLKQSQFNTTTLTVLYAIAILLLAYVYTRVNLKHYYKPLFIIGVISFFFFTIYLNIVVDGYTLNVDRWSAMTVGIEALLHGEYPYSAIDHLGGRTSNLPTLFFIGIPFYLIGNLGFLQSFAFLVFVYALFIIFKNYRDRLFCFALLVLSPAYLWEIYVKSDLMSNFIFVLLFVVIVQNRIFENKKINTGVLSFLSATLLLSRLTAIIPLTLLLFKTFYNFSLRKKIVFVTISILTLSLFTFICFNQVESLEHFKQHNPFELQNRQLPTLVSFITILIPTMYSFKIKNLQSLIQATTYFMLIPIMIALILNISEDGLYYNVIGSGFDISYFNIAMPFLLLLLTFEFKNVTKNSTLV